eukprot:s103_g5.t1
MLGDRLILAARKLSISSRKDKIGGKDGSWQVFMAWVPTGTALIQAESWKPSEKEAGGHTKDSDSDSSGSSRMDHKQQYTLLPVWEASERLQKKLRKNSRSEAASSAAYKEDEPDFGAETPPWYVLNPDTSPRVYWDATWQRLVRKVGSLQCLVGVAGWGWRTLIAIESRVFA